MTPKYVGTDIEPRGFVLTFPLVIAIHVGVLFLVPVYLQQYFHLLFTFRFGLCSDFVPVVPLL